ncbi:6556_t:CDS:1, partial [Acaulospora morrowiae]
MRTNILVYSQNSSNVEKTIETLKSIIGSHYDIISVDTKTLENESWQATTCCLLLPYSIDFASNEGKVNRRISDYVFKGGNYFGSGDSAAFATKNIDRERFGEDNNLGFFSGSYKRMLSIGNEIKRQLNNKIDKEIYPVMPTKQFMTCLRDT